MIQALIAPVAGLLDKFIEDKDTKNKIAFEISTMAERHAQQIALAQIEINKADAKGNWFQSSLALAASTRLNRWTPNDS
jgi:hypothetical protein